jgi:hypothetical protein
MASAPIKTNVLFILFSFPNSGGAAVSGGTLEQSRHFGFTGLLPRACPWIAPKVSASKK